MKFGKRLFAIVMASVMSASLLAGCGQQSTQETGVTTINIWSGDASKKEAWTVLTEQFNATTGKEKGIKVEWTFSTDCMTNMDVARQSDQMPDISQLTYVQAKDFANTGDIVPMNEIAGLEKYAEEFNTPKLQNVNVYNDKLYAFLNAADACGLIYNKDLFKAAGIVDENGEAKPPKTVEEMRDAAKKITDTANGVYGYSFPLKFATYYTINLAFKRSFNDIKYDYDKQTVDYSGVGEGFKVMMDLRDDGSLFPGAESLDNDTSRAYFAEGKIGMMPGMLWDVGVLTSQFVADCDWGVAPYPVVDEANLLPGYASVGGAYFVTKDGKEKGEKLAEVIKFMYSGEVVTEMYKRGLVLPYDMSLVKEGTECDIPQFGEFAETVDPEALVRLSPSLKIEGDAIDVLLGKVWSGNMTVEDAVADMNERATAALKKGVEEKTIDLEFFKNEQTKTSY